MLYLPCNSSQLYTFVDVPPSCDFDKQPPTKSNCNGDTTHGNRV